MKILLISIAILLVHFHTSAQEHGSTSTGDLNYGEAAVSYGTHLTGKLAINTLFGRNNIASVSLFFSTHKDPDAPSDFKPGLVATNPQQTFYMIGVCFGKVLYTNDPHIRYTVKAGPSVGIVNTPIDYEANGNWFSSNYSFSHKAKFSAGLLINPTLELPLKRHIGFSCGIFSNVTINGIVAGGEISMLFGALRRRHQ